MDIPTDVCVVCKDGPFGYLDGFILDPVKDEVTDLIVEADEFLKPKRLVPVKEIVKSTFRYILLNCTLHKLSEFELFADLEDHRIYSWPYKTTSPGYLSGQHGHIPTNKIVVWGSPYVFATDGKVGVLDELIIEPDNHKITDLLVRVGYFWGYQDIDIPLAQIENIKGDSVYLKLNMATIKSFPTVPDHADNEVGSYSELVR